MFHIGILMPYLKPCIDQIFSLFSANTARGKKISKRKYQSDRNSLCRSLKVHGERTGCTTVRCRTAALVLYGVLPRASSTDGPHSSADLGSRSGNPQLLAHPGTKTSSLNTEGTFCRVNLSGRGMKMKTRVLSFQGVA